MGCMCNKEIITKEEANMELKVKKYIEVVQCTCGIAYDQIQIEIIPLQCTHKLCVNCFRRAYSENSVLCPFCFRLQIYEQPLECVKNQATQQDSTTQVQNSQIQVESTEQQFLNQNQLPEQQVEKDQKAEEKQNENQSEDEENKIELSNNEQEKNKEENHIDESKKEQGQSLEWIDQSNFSQSKKILHISDAQQNKIHLYNLEQSQYQLMKLNKG